MADPKRKRKRKPKAAPAPVIPEVEAERDRDMLMFIDWLNGAGQVEIATKYGIAQPTVSKIAKRDKWRELQMDIKARKYQKAMEGLKDIVIQIKNAFEHDIGLILKDMKEKNRQLTPEERAHFRQIMDRFLKENRLEDGKPTDTLGVGGAVEHEMTLRLPPGMDPANFGIIPPDPKVKLLPAEQDQTNKRQYNVDDLEDKLDGSDKA